MNNNIKLEDNQIMDALIDGYDPFTGEMFSDDHILLNTRVKETLAKYVSLKVDNKSDSKVDYEDLSPKEQMLFDELKEWRLKKAREIHIPPYCIFSNRTLINLVKAKIEIKTDLLKIKGVRSNKFDEFGSELFEILK